MRKILFILFILIISKNNLFAQLSVSGSTPSNLVNTIAAGGIAVSNISYTGNTSSSGTFSCTGACNIGVSGGILLTSGYASIAAQPNTGTGQGAASCALNAGDPDLDNLTTGATQDACILEFDFVAVSDTVRFNYVFGSDEYSDYVGSAFNDVFAFFISGPGIAGQQNIAEIPGVSLPVTINNVNNGSALPGTPPTGPCTNCAFFLDNTLNSYTTAYDGLTTVLTATATSIQPGQTYHLKIGIADVADQVFDSGVFLEAGSFLAAGPVAMFVNGSRLTSNTVQLCAGDSVSLSAPAGFSYLWNTGATTQSITVSQAGNYSVLIVGSNSSYVVFSPIISVNINSNTIPVPVLSQNVNSILSSVNQSTYNYSWTYNGTVLPGNNSSSLTFNQSGCYGLVVEDSTIGCFMASDTLCVTPTGIQNVQNTFEMEISPNPANDLLLVNCPLKENSLLVFKIYSLTGKLIKQNLLTGTASSQQVDVSKLKQGFYTYSFERDGLMVKSGKLSIIR